MKRFALIAALVTLLVGIVAMPGSAASFDDSNPCPASGPLLVCPKGQVGQPYSLQLIALAGCDLYRWEIANGSLPAGLSMSSSGLVSGTPSASAKTEPWMTVHDLLPSEGGHAWCGGDNKSERQFVFEVVPGLSIQNQSVPAGTIGQPYSLTMTALAVTNTNPVQGSPASATWSVQSGSLPAGVTLTSAGLLSGTPTTEGSYTFVVRAVGGGGASDTETETLVVRQPVAATTTLARGPSAPKAEVGVPFTAAQTATGGTGTYTWTVASGSLPGGVVLDAATGALSGTPTAPGRYTFGLRATDAEGRVANVNATLLVAAELTITTRTLKNAKVGRAYRAKIGKVGGVAPVAWTVAGKLPKGLKFAPKLGLFLGKPTQSGKFRITVEAVDALEVEAQKRLTLTVKP
jgi:large repetitive protein